MKIPFSTSYRTVLVVLIAFLTLSASAALQLVTALNPATTAPADGDGDSWAPILSADGRFVLFASTADNLVTLDGSNGIPRLNPPSVNVYLRDRLNGTTKLVSVNLAGTGGGNGNSFPAGLSTNGQFALFESAASDLAANDTNNANDVFLRDMVNGVTRLVSVATNGASGNGASDDPTLTPDGRYVAFASAASNLVPNDTNDIPDVFVRDMQLGTTTLASAGATATGAGSLSAAPEITPDGRYVAFYSTAANLVPGVTTGGEIYVRDLQTGTTTWASTNARAISGFGTNGFCYNQAISDDGQSVAFEISSSNASGIATNGFILRYHLQTGLTDIVATNAACPMGAVPNKRSLNMTPDGRFIAYVAVINSTTTTSSVYLWDGQTGTQILVSGNLTNGITSGANVYWPDVDSSGRYVVFYSTDTNFVPQGGSRGGIFLRDVQAGTTTLVSVDTNGANLPVNSTAVPSLSADGGSVAFESPWANLDGRNLNCDVFVRDLANPASELISVHAPKLASVTPNGSCFLWPGSVSADGRYVAFSSWANNLAPNDTNGCLEVFERDLAVGANILVSVGTNDLAGNNFSSEPSISGNGRYVAFTSAASNLVAGNNNQALEVFVRDLQAGSTTLVSVSTNGGFGNNNSYLPTISADGRFVLFCSEARNLAPGTYSGDNLFLRDRQTGQTYGLTTNGYNWYSMTSNGDYVAFVTMTNSNLFVWNSQTATLIYTNTLGAFTNVSVSPDGHWLAYVSGNSLFAADLVAGTNCLVATGPFGPRAGLKFSGDGRLLTYAGANNVYVHDFQSGSNLLVSHAFDTNAPANGPSDSPVISANGQFVAYRSFASNCAPGISNGVPNVFLFDILSNSTTLASANASGAAAANVSLMPEFSRDGQMLDFQSWAPGLVAQDFNLGSDLLALDIFNLEGTNSTNSPPFNANIIFAGQNVSGPTSGPTPILNWPLTPGQSYSVQYKNNLNDPVWQNLPGIVTFIGNQAYLDDLSPSASQRFYRILQNN